MQKKALLPAALVFLLFLGTNAFALPLAHNITIPDTVSSGSGWYGPQEDQEVEPNCLTGQVWDLEGFFLEGSTLYVVGGFDFKDGYQGWEVGDIFIDTNFDALFGSSAPHYGGVQGGSSTVQDTFNYEYALRLDFANSQYEVYALDSDTTTLQVYYGQNDESNPYRYNDGGTLEGSGTLTFHEGLSDSDVAGLAGGDHYALELDLVALLGTDFISHLTYECGNDNMMGDTRSIPDATPLTLLGTAMIVAGLLCRRKVTG